MSRGCGAGLAAAGRASRRDAVLDLGPGRSVRFRAIPSPDGTAHVGHGMVRPLTVT